MLFCIILFCIILYFSSNMYLPTNTYTCVHHRLVRETRIIWWWVLYNMMMSSQRYNVVPPSQHLFLLDYLQTFLTHFCWLLCMLMHGFMWAQFSVILCLSEMKSSNFIACKLLVHFTISLCHWPNSRKYIYTIADHSYMLYVYVIFFCLPQFDTPFPIECLFYLNVLYLPLLFRDITMCCIDYHAFINTCFFFNSNNMKHLHNIRLSLIEIITMNN